MPENFKIPPLPSGYPGKSWAGIAFFFAFLVSFWVCLWSLMHALTPENPGFQVLPALNEGDPLPVIPGAPPPIRTIVIDAGHGGEDPGTQGNGLIEKNGTLPIALAVANELRARKHYVFMTRETDTTISLESRSRIANQPGHLCFVSIHLNHSQSPKSAGVETYFGWPKRLEVMKYMRTSRKLTKNDDFTDNRGKLLAEAVHSSILATTKAPDREVRNNAGLYLLNSIHIPSILIECGFVSNKTETDKIRSKEYQEQLAKGVADGIEAFLKATEADPNYGIAISSTKSTAEKK